MGSLHPPRYSSSTPHFFKTILGAASTQKLKIPKKFVMKFGEELSSSVYLKLPSGAEWKVGLTRCNGKIWFEKGWPEFSVFFSLDYGNFLVFRYEGNSHFHVCICDTSATEIDYPVKSPRIEEADENDDSPVEILENFPPTQRREKSPLPCPSRKRMRTSSSDEVDMIFRDCRDSCSSERFLNRTPHEVRGRMKTSTENKKANAFKSDNPCFSITMPPSSINWDMLSLPNEFARRYLMKLPARIAILQVSDGRTWHVKFKYDHVNSRARLQKGWSSFARDNNLKVGDACVFTLINCIELSFEVDISPTKESTERPLSTGHGRGAISQAENTRNPIFKVEPECNMDSVSCSLEIGKNKNSKFSGDVTQRPSSSLGDLRVNVESADMFASENPFCEVTLKSYNMKKSIVRVPVNFARSSIEPGKHIVNLQVKDRSWPVNLIKHDKPRPSTTINGGWAVFAKENCLKEGDVCIFELIEKKDIVLEVHIIRC